jgi:aminopeptidase YwaD
MFKATCKLLEKEVSGQSAFNFLSEISRYHRIQASPGIREAVEWAVESMKSHGLDAEVHSYPADGTSYLWSDHLFKEWSCEDAELRLVEPEEEAQPLALWSETKHSLIERCHPTPREGVEAEVVVLEKGEEVSDYKNVDVRGKVVVTNGDVARVHELAVKRYGAIGIIFDGMSLYPPIRREGDLDDALQRGRSGGWTGDEEPCFGFVLTPRKGRWLRQLVEEQRKKKKPVKVYARVDSRFYKGTIENAVGKIPGETEEEVTMVAHICHPQGYANDNASGCGAAMEAARALQRLISRGELAKPKRTIRVTLVPEMGGSFAWLHENEERLSDMVAAVNLDMVGENQDLCGGPFILVRTPDSMPSFANVLMEAILDDIKKEGKGIGGAMVPLKKYAVTPFSSGSDHYVYSDPTVGVPCVGLAQWPDKFYHTSWDTLDKVDPEMMRKSALMTAVYAYFIANSGVREALWLTSEATSRIKGSIGDTAQNMLTEAMDEAEKEEKPERSLVDALGKIVEKIDYDTRIGIDVIESIQRLARDDPSYTSYKEKKIKELLDASEAEKKHLKEAIEEYAKMRGLTLPKKKGKRMSKLEREASSLTPKRLYRGPVSVGGYTHRPWFYGLSEEDKDGLWKLSKENKEARGATTLALYWADGKRNLLDISRLVELETGRTDLAFLIGFFRFLEKMKLVQFE